MPIFDKELIDNVSNRENPIPNMPLASPTIKELNTDMGGYGLDTDPKGGMTIDQLSNIKLSNSAGFDSPFQMIPKSELLSNKRYSLYERDKDIENIYGLNQGALAQLGNGVVKMAATAAGTFLQGFATIPNTIAAFKGGTKELAGVEGYESDIDNWLKNIEDRFPNYVTKKEQEHPFLAAIPGFAGSANFWGDKIIKNIGFTVGAIGSALVQDAVVGFATEGIGEIPLVANQIGKASLWLNKLFTGTNDIEKTLELATALGKSQKTMLNIKRLGELAAAEKVTNGFRYGLNIYSSARTEAAVEARDGYRQVKEALINQYKGENLGEEPSGKALTDIENYATDAMNTRFGINMAILTVSNAIQFDNLFKSFSNGSVTRGIGSGLVKDIEEVGKVGLKQGSLDVFEKKAPATFMGKVWESVKPKTASIFREGVYEEGGQYAAERGTYDYYTRKYKDPKRRESVDNWNSLNEVISSTGKGLKDQFGTTEGIENMLIGGISGMLMDAGMQTYDRATGKGKDKRLDTAVNLLNRYGLTGILGQKYTDTLNSVNIAQEMAKAAKEGNVFRFQNLKEDMFFGFVNSRLGSNMHDVTIEQLRMLKDLDKEEFEKTFGMDFSTSNKTTVNEYVDGLINKANEIKKISDSVNNTYKNVFTFYDDPGDDQDKKDSNKNYNTFETWKTNLIYEGSVMKNTNERLNDMQQSLSKINPLMTNDLASTLMDEDSLRELSKDYEDEAKTILDMLNDNMSFEEKRKIKEQAKQLRTASEIAMMAANEGRISQKDFAKLVNYELNNRDASKEDVVSIDKIKDIQTFGHDINMINARKRDASNAFEILSSEKGFEKFFKDENDIAAAAEKEAFDREEVKKRPLPEFTNVGGNKEAITLDREYQVGLKKKAKVRKIAADRFKVTSPDGKVTFYPTREAANEAADDINERTRELSKVKILAVNADGTIKIEDIKGNIQNIGLGELEGYEKIITEQERLQQFADQMKKDQEEIEKSSGVVGTNPSDEETIVFEEKKRDVAHLFTGGITESEKWENPEGIPIHIQNSRYFLNNARNFPNRANLRAILVPASHEAAFGLAGLTAISYKSEEKDPTKIPGATDPKTGFIAQVFVEQDGSDVYFVDKDGNRIGKLGETIDVDKVIFQPMPAASLEYSDGSSRYRNHQAADAEIHKKAWEIKRNRLFGATPGTYQLYTFKISRGIAREIKVDGRLERNPVSEVLVDMNMIPTQEGLIQISTTGNLAHQGEQLNFPKGRPILQFEDVFVPLNNRKFTANEAETIFELLNKIGKETVRQSKLPGGPAIRTNRKYARFLQGLLFWKSEITGKKNPNNMYINEKEGNLYLGGVAYDLTNLEASKDLIINHLKETYNNINNSHLTDTFSEPFIEYRMENGDLIEVEWQNYQTYLLSKENPDGSSRGVENIPLVTSVQKATDTLQPFEQKYAIMEDLELPIAEVPKPETKVSKDGTVEVDGFKIDGSVQTYRGFNAGPVEFTATLDKDGFIETDVKDGDTVNTLAGNEKTMNDVIIATLKALNKLDEKALEANDNVRLVKDFLGLKIAVDLQAKLDATKNKTSTSSTAPKASAPIEISSNAKGFGAVLTNPTEIASSKKNITNVVNIKNKYGDKYKILKRFVIGRGIVDVAVTDTTNAAYPIEFEGQLYADAEAAYQDQKAKYSKKTKSAGSTYDLMVKILTAKLQQYPQMVDEIKKQGGVSWLSKAVHQPTNKNSVWETGGQNWFVLSLVDAYTKVLESAPAAPVITDAKAAIEKDENGEFIPKKYTLNAKGENPAPNIPLSAIDAKSFGEEELPKGVKQVKLLEIRGRNSEGKLVGKVLIQKEDGGTYDAEVFFNDTELAALEGGETSTQTEAPTVNIKAEKKKLEAERDKKIEEEAPIQTMDYPLGFMSDGKTISLEKISELLKEDKQNKLKALERIALILAEVGVQPLYIAKQNSEAIKKILSFYPNYYGTLRDWEGKDIDALSNKHALRITNFFNGFQFEDIRLAWGVRFSNEKSEYTSKQIKESSAVQEKLGPADRWSTEPNMGYVAALRWAQMKLAGQTTRSLGEFLLDTQKEIRDEYQAKIDALDEKKPPETPPPAAPSGPTPTVVFEDDDTPDDSFRRLSKVKERSWRTTQGDIEIFKKWVAENVPGMPYEILEQMIDTYDGEKAWGVYENGVAKFFKGGLRGTEYHEIFEGIWKHFLTDSEKQAIIDEFRTKAGKFTDRESGKKFSYDDSSVTDQMIKERIADDFADFRLGKIPAKTIGGKIMQFFKRIIDFVKSFLFKPDLKTKLFQQIDTGRFKTATLQITKDDVDNTFKKDPELENKVLESYGYVAAYQGTRGDIDNREVNYFTLDENEASDYGITRKVAINTEGFIDATTDEYRNLKNEDQKLTGTRVDLMDNSVEGLAKQQQFFNFLMSKGYKGIDNTGFEDSKYLIAFQNQDFEKQAEVPKMLYTKYIKSVQSRGSETDMDKFQQWAKNYGIPEYSRAGILTETQTHQFVQDLTARAAGIIFNENDVQALYEPAKLTSNELFTKIANQKDMVNKKAKMGEETWNALIVKTKEQLRTLGVDFTEEDRVSINDSEKTNRDYAPEPFATDWKKYSYFPIKILLATLIETEPMNQSTSTELKMPNAKFSTEARGLSLVNFSRTFATLMDRLSNTTDVDEFIAKLTELAKEDSRFVRLFVRLGGGKDWTIDFSQAKYKSANWRLFTQFYQTFTKQNPEAIAQYINDSQVYSGSAALTGAANMIKKEWVENIKALSKKSDSLITYDRPSRTYKVKDISKIPIKDLDDQIEFLKQMGVIFDKDAYLALNSVDRNKFGRAVSNIHAFLQKATDIFSVTSRTLNIEGHLNTLSELYVKATNPNQDTTHFNIDGNRTNSFAENNVPSVFENEFNESKTIQELIKKRPDLNDVFSQHSILLQLGGPFWTKDGKRTARKLKIGYIGGTINVNKNKGVSTQKLNIGTRFTQEINQNLAGNYYILVPADSSTEWMMNLGNNISFIDVDSENGKSAWKKINSIFRGYLIDEVALALDYKNREKLRNVGEKRSRQLRFFKEILSDSLLTKIHNMILAKKSLTEITAEIDSNIDEVNASVKDFIEKTTSDTRSNLEKTGKIKIVDENNFSYPELDNTFTDDENVNINKFKMSNELVNNVLLFANANYIINNIELHKIIFGDPYQFEEKTKNGKTLLDETKRIKSFLSPRRSTFDHAAFRSFLNTEYNKTGLPEEADRIALKPSDPGYHMAKRYLRTITASDVNIIGRVLGKAKETDGMSWLTIDGYREIKQRNGQWSNDAETWYQWQMAYMRNRMAAKGDYNYDNPALEKHDAELIKKKEPIYKLDILKPIATGSKYNKNNIDLLLDKFSQMPMYYKAVEGRTLERLLVKMFNEKIDYVIVQSGRKVGTETLHDLYNPDGTFNQEAFTDTIDVSWKTYGIQVENAYEGSGGQQTMGSQVTKIVTMDLFENGEAVSKDGATLYKKYNTILTNLFTNGYQRLLKDLGIEDLGFSFKLINNDSISNTLRQEMLRRELSENAKDTIQLKDGEFILPFEASSSYKQIKDILYSMVHKAIISPKMNGGGYVQVPVTMWENSKEGRRVGVKENGKSRIVTSEEFKKLPPEVQETAFFTDDTLKFYTEKEPYCEILLPHWFKDKFEGTQYDTDEKILKYLNDSEEGKEILKGIAFRIPTQLQSSIEAVVIKGFLPQSMGKTVVVPSEIVSKAGSDFDIDKLSMYLKSVYVDADGDIRLARFMQDEASTREFYGDVYDRTIGKEISKLEKYEGFRDKMVQIFEAIESLEVVDSQSIEDKLSEEDYYFYDTHIKLLSEIVNQAAEKDINPSAFIREQIKALGEKKESLIAKQLNQSLKENYVEDMYRRALENEYYDTMYKIITLPENLERLLSPVDDDGLSELADELDELRGYDESNIKNRILDRNYMTTLRHAFVSAKRWIGIAAVNITGHSLYQKTKVYIDPEMFGDVSKSDQKILGDGFIALKHNTVDINGNKYISLSGRKDSAGRFISNGLSGFATTFVDVAKDPYIMKIIKNEMVVGTFMFARRIGISREDIVMFMNQPIIDAYLTMLDNSGEKGLFKDGNIVAIRMQFPAGSEQGVIDTNDFRSAIKDYYQGELSPKQNANQQEIFTQFLRLAKMADYSYKMSQAVNYDTTRFKSGDSLFQKQVRTQLAREANIINSVDNILNNSHIGHQELLLDYSMEAIGEILKLERDDFREITDELLRKYAENFYMSADDYEKIAIRIKSSFLDYIIQTKSNVASNINRLLVEGGDVLVDRLATLKQKYPNLQILKDLVPATSVRIDGAKSIELKANLKDAYDENLYIGMMRELRDSGNLELNEFYHDLVTLSILQGTLQSPISIKNIIPIEDYSAKIKDIIAPLTVDEDVRNFNKGAFQRNNWKSDEVFEEYEPKFFKSEDPVDIDPYTMEDIYEYFSYAFQPHKKLNLGRNQRMLMFVSENSYASQNNYLKIRRTIQEKNNEGQPIQSWIDLRSGVNIFAADFAIRKKRGDLALQDYYGYEKVTYEDGTPLTITNSKGYTSHVYKLVNLWGDGMYASEYYLDNKPSVINNGTVKVEKELTNGEIIQAFTERTEKANTDTSSPTSLGNTIKPVQLSTNVGIKSIQPKMNIVNYRTMDDKSKDDAINGVEEAQKRWVEEEIAEFYEAVYQVNNGLDTFSSKGVNKGKATMDDVIDETLGIFRTIQMFPKFSDLILPYLDDIKTAMNTFGRREGYAIYKAKKDAKGQAKEMTYENLFEVVDRFIKPAETSDVKYSDLKVGQVLNVTSKEDSNVTGFLTVSEIEKPDFIRFDLNFSDGTRESGIGYSEKEFNELFTINKSTETNIDALRAEEKAALDVLDFVKAREIRDRIDALSTSTEREYTPEKLTKANMPANGIFVFGSNTEGRHGKGAAEDAKDMFGAIQGQAEGLQGKSYAIITKDLSKGKRSVPLYSMDDTSIAYGIKRFMEYANSHPELKFYVAKLGSSLAGYSIEEIKDIFNSINTLYAYEGIQNYIPNNVILPREYEVRLEKKPATELKLRDGLMYQSADINGTMLENIGYSPLEIAEILKQIC